MRLIIVAILITLLAACAQTGQLTGGPIDAAAPQPDSLGIHPPSESINIYPKNIKIEFKEFIRLNNPQKNVIIVPNVEPKPAYKIKGKTFYIQFADSSLQANTTYAIYMNGAVKDITEGNDSLMNYVFSTGNFIDSLTHQVVVRNAFTNLPEENVMVGLYTITDTLSPYEDIPTYFAKTDQSGLATFYYMKKGNYMLFAFKNKSGLMKPGQSDPIAFKTSNVFVDTSSTTDTLALFGKALDKLRFVKKEIELPGKIELVCTRTLDNADIFIEKDSLKLDFIRINTNRKDSVFLWFKGEKNTSYTVNIAWKDTTLVSRLFLGKNKASKTRFSTNINGGFVGRFDSLKLFSTYPINAFDTTKWQLLNKDSVQIPIKIVQDSKMSLSAINRWEDEHKYTLRILPGGIVDFYGNSNEDTLNHAWQRKPLYKLANLVLVLENKPDIPLIVEVLGSKSGPIQHFVNSTDTLIDLKLIDPGEYIVRVVLDENNNKKWDTGNYDEKIQPEKVLWFREAIKLRSNWDSKVTLKFSL